MAVFSKQGLLAELLDRTELIKANTQTFLRLPDEQLLLQPAPGKWSVAEIFGHLNISHESYIRIILTRITAAPDVPPMNEYRSGWIGEWLYTRNMPRPDGTVFKMRAQKAHHPEKEVSDAKEVLQQFLSTCDAIDDILRHAATKDLQRIRIPFGSSGFIRLRLGDLLRFLVAHSERHLLQAQRTVSRLPVVS